SLRAAGVPADRALERRALVLATQAETYVRRGRFDAEDALAMLDEHIDAALADGFFGLRATGESSRPVSDDVWPEVRRYEALMNERFARRPFIGLCRFHTAALDADRLRDVLRVHPLAFVRGDACANPFYERPEIALGDDSRARVEWQLHQVRAHHRARQRSEDMAESAIATAVTLDADRAESAAAASELRRSVHARDRFLSTLAEDLAEPLFALKREVHALGLGLGQGLDETPAPQRLEAASRHLRRLTTAIDQARDVAQLLDPSPNVGGSDCDLVELVGEVARRHREDAPVPGCRIEIEAEGPLRGRWDRANVRRLVSALVADLLGRDVERLVVIGVAADAVSATLRFDAAARSDAGVPVSPAPSPGLEPHLVRELANAAGGRLVDAPEGRPAASRGYVVELPRRSAQPPS
ncbi:MAG: Sensory box histidine kinase, partial [Myxococcales bacterium]|nr:Sensory box histidine kinase [Myxococcales bacterium]